MNYEEGHAFTIRHFGQVPQMHRQNFTCSANSSNAYTNPLASPIRRELRSGFARRTDMLSVHKIVAHE